jgi:hypothetical protein
MRRNDGNFGLLVLKFGCVFSGLFSLLTLTPRFRSAGSHNHLQDFVSLLNLFIFAAGFYGIQRNERLTWQLGWFAGGILLSEWLVLSLAPILNHPRPNEWIAPAVFVTCGFATFKIARHVSTDSAPIGRCQAPNRGRGRHVTRTHSITFPNSTYRTSPHSTTGNRVDAPAYTPVRDGGLREKACSTAFPGQPAKV